MPPLPDNTLSSETANHFAHKSGPVDKIAQEASMWYNKHEEG